MSTPFASAAPYYARYRSPYPREIHTLLADRFALDGSQTVLDLGAGPGTLGLPLASLADHVYAVDPEPAMLAEGTRLAEERGLTNISWLRGDAARVTRLCLPRIDLCVIGKAFHRMDRGRLLADLDDVLAPRGGLGVVVSLRRPGDRGPAWLAAVEEVRERFLGPGSPGQSDLDDWEDLGDLLAKSPFSRVETHRCDLLVRRTVDEVIGLQLSFPSSSPAVLGDRMAAFEAELRRALLDHDPRGTYARTLRIGAAVATRPRR
ncbi:class I SAM-dependent methyltransferase [Streptomyces sp. PCS3-D2]|uniref:class I SAM-dependent methyltransferase n=1 Tax=Streptomyces sp. PCS3-D2 TaxID=1460244 RepID=UPI00044EBDDA|nr:class I SAM-dependent methyltransferase [Streptomyces sp. PCS3-D2]WKV75746.1 class I SAM-dependent methyltransferase [Streptomyces sp. PCS3-D2]